MEGKYKKITNVLFIVLGANISTALLKLLYGFWIKSVSIVADGAHSIGDAFSTIIGLIAIFIAGKPRDKTHPYGHKKFETFFTLIIGLLLFLIAFNVIRSAIVRWYNPVVPEVSPESFLILSITLSINILIMRYELKKGAQLESDILLSDALHTKSDILVSLSVICTLIAVLLGYPIFDVLVAFCIALVIIFASINIIRGASKVLVDTAVLPIEKIETVVESLPEVLKCYNIRSHGRKDDIHVDLHVAVDNCLNISEAHDIAHKIETEIKMQFPGVSEVNVHVEPIEHTLSLQHLNLSDNIKK